MYFANGGEATVSVIHSVLLGRMKVGLSKPVKCNFALKLP